MPWRKPIATSRGARAESALVGRVRAYRSRTDWSAFDDALRQVAVATPMQSRVWLESCWSAYQQPASQLLLAVVHDVDDSGLVLGAAAFTLHNSGGLRRIRLLGDGPACSDHATVRCRPGREGAAAAALADWLVHDVGDLWDEVRLEAVDADEIPLRAVVRRLGEHGGLVACREEPGTWGVDLPPTWEAYLEGLSKNHRKRCLRWQREFFESGVASVQVIREAGPCLEALGTLCDLHAERRNRLGDGGAFASAEFRRFHQRAVDALAEQGQVQMRLLSLGGREVAAEYVLDDGRTLYAYQSGLAAEGEAVSAGSLSLLALVHDAIQAGRRRVDLLRGGEFYKRHWGATRLPAATFVVRQPTLAGRFAVGWETLCESLRSRRSSTDSPPIGAD